MENLGIQNRIEDCPPKINLQKSLFLDPNFSANSQTQTAFRAGGLVSSLRQPLLPYKVLCCSKEPKPKSYLGLVLSGVATPMGFGFQQSNWKSTPRILKYHDFLSRDLLQAKIPSQRNQHHHPITNIRVKLHKIPLKTNFLGTDSH